MSESCSPKRDEEDDNEKKKEKEEVGGRRKHFKTVLPKRLKRLVTRKQDLSREKVKKDFQIASEPFSHLGFCSVDADTEKEERE
jgi:hypothetical protein